jgi:aryl-alcohol dehydrogenase-like predicted oxidoreductase
MIGTSNFSAERIVENRWAAGRLGTQRMMTEQLPYGVFVRHAEPSVLPTAARYGLGVLVWSPPNMGWLAGKYSREEVPGTDVVPSDTAPYNADMRRAARRRRRR